MTFTATKASVLNRGRMSDEFLTELVTWGKTAAEDIFAPRVDLKGESDIYNAIIVELGPWRSIAHRRAALLEVMRVLALFESGGDWTEGVDTSRLGEDTPSNAEAGAWQVSYGVRNVASELRELLNRNNIINAIEFQRAMKFNHIVAMEFVARMLRHTRKENGPLYKGDERLGIRKSLRGPEQSVYPWLSQAATAEFEGLMM